jgi:hypothetical protein
VLPRDAYATMPDETVKQLLDTLASDRGWDYFSYLYIRMGDAGPRALSFYEQDLSRLQSQGRDAIPAILAICRIGEASEQAKAILRTKFIQSSKSDTYDDFVRINSAIFVTLLKLHDSTVVDAYPTNFRRDSIVSWYDAVRRGRGQTDIGPNNCRGWDWAQRHRPSSLQPGLVFEDSGWTEARTK